MRKIVLAFLVILLVRMAVQAQPQAYDAKIDYQKTRQNAVAIELPFNQEVVGDAIKDYMGGKGHKGSSFRGFTVYRGVKLGDSDGDTKDLHFRIDRKTRRDKSASTVYLLVANPSEDPATRQVAGDDAPTDKARAFLNAMVPAVEAHDLEVQIKTQEEIVKKALKKSNGLADDQTDLEKKIRNTQADLDQNKKDQLKQSRDAQSISHNDDEAMKKANKKMNRLVDDQGDLLKKLRKYETALDQNKLDQAAQQKELDKQQQILDSMKSHRKG